VTMRRDRGFSLVEMVVIILILGMMLALGIPAMRGFTESNRLRGSTENIAAQIRLAREKAIGTGVEQTFHFYLDTHDADYHIHNIFTPPGPLWSFPKGIVYDETPADDLDTLRLKRDGRASPAGVIVLRDSRGVRDTINIQLSGLVLTY
jgi:type II secretory pathway pseudopilin PulG